MPGGSGGRLHADQAEHRTKKQMSKEKERTERTKTGYSMEENHGNKSEEKKDSRKKRQMK